MMRNADAGGGRDSGRASSGGPILAGEPVLAALRRHAALPDEAMLGDAGARMACFASPEHNIAKRLGLYTLLLGGTALLSAARGEALNAFLRAARADWLYGSLQHAADLVALGRRGHPLPPGVTLRVGGLRVPLALRHEVLAHVAPDFRVSYGATETYGATEIGSIASAGPGQHDEEGSVGLVVPGVEVGILRADGTEAAAGEPGAIRIRAPGMATAYHDDPEQTAERFRGGWFHPGDMVSRRADGTLVVHGRADDMMILNGINIFPAEIEAMLESHPAVTHAAALPVPSTAHGEIPVAAVELRPGAQASAAELLAFARARLGLRAPRRVLVLDALPRTPQGKVMGRDLATRFAPAGSA